MIIANLKPAVPKHWLILMAGLLWSVVGLLLCRLAYNWLAAVSLGSALFLGTTGILLSLAVYRFGFSKIASKNIDRLCLLADKSCIFAFQAWQSYLIVGIMIVMGIILRHSPIPKQYLAVIYMTMGGALFLSSFHYYQRAWQVMILKRPGRPPAKTVK